MRPATSHTFPQRRLGFGLLEILLVVAILLTASAIIFSIYRSAQRTAQIDTQINYNNVLVGNVRSIWPRHDYFGVGDYTLAKSPQLFPKASLPADSSLTVAVTPWLSGFKVWAAARQSTTMLRHCSTASGGGQVEPCNFFEVIYTNMSKNPDVCIPFLMSLAGQAPYLRSDSVDLKPNGQVSNSAIATACATKSTSTIYAGYP